MSTKTVQKLTPPRTKQTILLVDAETEKRIEKSLQNLENGKFYKVNMNHKGEREKVLEA
jgi:hypothetical protein